MPPKKAVENSDTKVEKPDDGALLFAFEVLKNIGKDGMLDMAALSKALGHTNVMSTRNAFGRHKKKWGFGNVQTKSSAGTSTPPEENVDLADLLKANNDANKVTKKRGRVGTKGKKAAAVVGQPTAPELKSEASDTD